MSTTGILFYHRTSILALLLFAGVSSGRGLRAAAGDVAAADTLRPIVTRSQQRRICAELCMSGLGGAPCGEDCVDLVPDNLPLEYVPAGAGRNRNTSSSHSRAARHAACDVLCENDLGVPLCQCQRQGDKKGTDFFEVCSFFCLHFAYQISGCQKCSLYNTTVMASRDTVSNRILVSFKAHVDWDTWCHEMCQSGDGGAACNCDLLPMDLVVDD